MIIHRKGRGREGERERERERDRTVGYWIYNASPFSIQEMLYAIAVMVVGKLLFGFILGSIASTLANLDTQRVLFEEKLIALKVRVMMMQYCSTCLPS